jgi:AmmeMemoRadiSam system protein B
MQETKISTATRAPLMAGFFYPEEKDKLEWHLQAFGLVRRSAMAILVPHGDWTVFGQAAALGFAAAQGRESGGLHISGKGVRRVLLAGCCHVVKQRGIFLSESSSFNTPLGSIPVDTYTSRAFVDSNPFITFDDIPHLEESVLETQLPFIKHCFPRCSLLPILMGGGELRPDGLYDWKPLIDALAHAFKTIMHPLMDETLLVICGNLPVDKDEAQARKRADEAIRLLEDNNVEAYTRAVVDGRADMCGGPVLAAMLQSGILEGRSARLIDGSFGKGEDEDGRHGFYGSFAWD